MQFYLIEAGLPPPEKKTHEEHGSHNTGKVWINSCFQKDNILQGGQKTWNLTI